jgi:hypothetical protein
MVDGSDFFLPRRRRHGWVGRLWRPLAKDQARRRGRWLLHLQLDVQVGELLRRGGAGRVGKSGLCLARFVAQIGNLLFRGLAACIAPLCQITPADYQSAIQQTKQTVCATSPSAQAWASVASPSTRCAGRGVVSAQPSRVSRSSGLCPSRFSGTQSHRGCSAYCRGSR